jgi:maltose alpha-D-glucosyltransferase / alpha-amylase
VEAQRRDSSSLLNWVVKMIRLRKECPEIGWGECTILPTGCPSILAMLYTWGQNRALTLHNFDHSAQEARIRVPGPEGELLTNLLATDESRSRKSGEHRIAIEDLGYRWYRVGGLGYSLNPSRSTVALER